MNEKIAGHGLALTGPEMLGLARRHAETLQNTNRVEFGEGILPRLAFLFCDSPHIAPAAFAATLEALMECFYHFKNETMEAMSDEELLAYMKTHFDGDCQGSVEYLAGTLLEELAAELRAGGRYVPPGELPMEEVPDAEE